MWEQFRILKFPWIILFILIGGIFLISSSDLVSMFLSIEFNSYVIDIFATLHRNYEFSTTAGYFYMNPFLLLAAIIPIKSYPNAEADKVTILKENKNKSGIYMWKNLINKKKYIGSSDNLKLRFSEYFNTNYLLKHNYMAICCALFKHDYTKFSLTILEYCEISELLTKEKYYWKLFTPEYNIAKDPTAPMSGRKHSEKTISILSEANTGSAARESTRARCASREKSYVWKKS